MFMTSAVAYAITGSVEISLSIGLIDTFFKIFTYYGFDILWTKLSRKKYKTSVVWLTGLSGSGKTTIGREMFERLKKEGIPAMLLDGDEIREMFKQTGFDKESRDRHVENVGKMAAFLQKRGIVAIVTLIAPYEEVRNKCRDMVSNFIEVHVNTSLEVCEARDVKGLYKKVRAGEIKQFTGIHSDAPYEQPSNPELTIDTEDKTVDQCVKIILTKLKK